jgi:uncharacterized protein (DUF1697 family)
MQRYVAFLRAINVGGHVVKMDALKRLFEGMKLANVATFIASGNVIFDANGKAPALEKKIEKTLQDALGYRVATFLRTLPELQTIAEAQPFGDEEGTIYVGFMTELPPAEAQKKLLALATPEERLHFSGRELYWLRKPGKWVDSPLAGPLLERTLGRETTLRNRNTVQRIVAKY